MVKLSRRGFLIGGAVVGGTLAAGMALGVGFLSTIDTTGLDGAMLPDGTLALNAWVHIRPDGQIIFAIPRTEMGQGIHTALPMLIAEEMELSLDAANVSVIHPTENLPVYANFTIGLNKRPEEMGGVGDWIGKKIFGLVPYIATGGSSSVVDAFTPLRRAGAAARSMLLQAAAQHWAVPQGGLYAEDGHIINRNTGERLAYGTLAATAATMKPDRALALKPAEDFRLIGKATPRLDLPAKVNGTARFGIDTVLPNMLHATIVQAPVFGGTVKKVDDSAAMKSPRVHKVVAMGNAVGVIADTYYHARKAADLLEIEFDDGPHAGLDSDTVMQILRAALAGDQVQVVEEIAGPSVEANGDMLEATYEVPYLAHACLEPMNCTALYQDGKLEMWASSQSPLSMLWAADGLDTPNGVVTNVTLAGGGFGRRIEKDFAVYAAKLAALMPGRPIKCVWSRAEDIQHDMYRPAAVAHMRARTGADNLPVAFEYEVAVQSTLANFSHRNLPMAEDAQKDPSNTEGATGLLYGIFPRRISSVAVNLPVPVGFWRSVGHSYNGFFIEGFMDELAHKHGRDPMEFRQALLRGNPGHERAEKLADTLARAAARGGNLPAGRHQGVAMHRSFRSLVGQVAEISVDENKAVKIHKITCVVDCGQVVNPDTVKAQMEGAISFALSALMYGEITIQGGRVVQENFPDYDMVRMADCPAIEVIIMDNHEAPGGVGEPGVPPLAPAVVNAIFAANGQRIRSLPLMKHGYSFA